MHRLHSVLALATAAGLAAATLPIAAGDAGAQQQRQTRPSQRPPAVNRDRWIYSPPPPSTSERNYYGPAPGVQQPMERVPMPAPLAQPPINR